MAVCHLISIIGYLLLSQRLLETNKNQEDKRFNQPDILLYN